MNEDVVAIFIPITAIVFSLTLPMVLAWIDYRRRRDIVEAHHRERLAAIERGIEIAPLPESFYQLGRKRRASYLLPGLVWAFIGVSGFVALNAIAGEDARFLAAVPFGVGLAYLIYHYVEGRKLPPPGVDGVG